MNILGKMSCVAVALLSMNACRPTTSAVKEFEFHADICSALQNAADTRWSASSGQTKAEYYDNLLATERQIIDYELPRYRQRLADMRSGQGPANGPGGQTVFLSNPPSLSTPDEPTKSQAEQDLSSEKSNLVTGSSQIAQEACPGCSIQEVESKLRVLESNQGRIANCQLQDSTSVSAASSDPDETLTAQQKLDRANTVNQIANLIIGATQAKELCTWWGSVASGTGASRDRCQRETISAFCKAAISAGTAVATGTINDRSEEKIATSAIKGIPRAIKDSMIGCVQQLAYDTVKDALRNAGTREFVPQATQQLAKDAIKSDRLETLTAEEKAAKSAELKKQLALLVCKAGASIVASQIDAQPQINYEHPCRAIFATSKSRARACLNTTSSACKIGAGDIDLANFLPSGLLDERPIATIVAEAGNLIASAGCKAGGKVGTAACATISEAASQIRTAIMTGNNDWAHCLGADQAGACTGSVVTEWMLGVKAADFKESVRPVVHSEVEGYFEQDICFCSYSCFQDDWGSNTELFRRNYYSVISNGAAGQRQCDQKDGQWNWTGLKSKQGYYIYWQRHGCMIQRARSKDESNFSSRGGFEVKVNGAWVYKNVSSEAGACPSGL